MIFIYVEKWYEVLIVMFLQLQNSTHYRATTCIGYLSYILFWFSFFKMFQVFGFDLWCFISWSLCLKYLACEGGFKARANSEEDFWNRLSWQQCCKSHLNSNNNSPHRLGIVVHFLTPVEVIVINVSTIGDRWSRQAGSLVDNMADLAVAIFLRTMGAM